MFTVPRYAAGMAQDRKSAARAARELLLSDRLPVIEDLAEAKSKLATLADREAKAREAREQGEDEMRARWEAALRKGWTKRELRGLGFEEPVKRRDTAARAKGSTPRSSTTGSSAPPEPAGVGTVSVSAGAGDG